MGSLLGKIAEKHYVVVGKTCDGRSGQILKSADLVKQEVDYFGITRWEYLTGVNKGDELTDFSDIVTLGKSNQPKNIVLYIKPNITSIDVDAFNGSEWLHTVLFLSDINGKSCKNIGYHSFAFCENLKTLILPNDLENIGDSAFCGCRNLNKVLSARVVDKDDVNSVIATLSSSKKLFDISTLGTNAGKLIIGKNAFARCYSLPKNNKIKLPPLRIYSGSANDLVVEK